MIIDPTIKFLGPVAVLSTSGTLDLFSRENGLADFSILLSALLPESEPACKPAESKENYIYK